MVIAGTIAACNTGKNRGANETGSSFGADSGFDGNFYPFPQYLEGQLAYVDSMPFALEMIRTLNGRTVDSSYVDRQLLHRDIEPFFEEDPNNDELKKHFKENAFEDLSVDAITFSIVALAEKTKLRQADILLDPATQRVKTVNIRRAFTRGDSSVFQNLLWVHNYRCQLVEEIKLQNGENLQRITRYTWDAPPGDSFVD